MKRKQMMIRIPERLYVIVERRAQKRLRSINSEMVVLLKMGLVSKESEDKALAAADVFIAKLGLKDKN